MTSLPSKKRDALTGDLWGGLSAMLVALPSAIAFGVTIFSSLGRSYAAQGAIAGILGTTALGLVASTLGGTKRLITAPCAPASAVLAALALELSQQGLAPEAVVLMLTLVALACGALQVAFGAIGLGRLIKYMPHPVVSGYLSGVGLLIIASQVPKLLGAPAGTAWWQAVTRVSAWQWQAMAVGTVTMAAMLAAPKVTRAVPAPVVGLGCGLLTYFGLALSDRSLLVLAGNHLVLGSIGTSGGGFLATAAARWRGIGGFSPDQFRILVTASLTLAVLLSIDTLKTCLILDAVTRTRHDSNRELIGQGCGNLASALAGGVPGAGTMGATLVNISSGAQTQRSGAITGVLALLAFLILAPLLAWVPIPALAGILIVIGFRMFDAHSLHLLRSRSTVLDFFVIVAVVVVALTLSLIAASGVGIGLAILLFLREQIGGSVVRRKTYGNRMFSKQARLPQEMELLEERGDRCVIFQLQGSLFFGTTDQLYRALEPDLKVRTYVILDMRGVHSIDLTAAHLLEQIEDILAERQAFLILSHFPRQAPSGKDMHHYLGQVGVVRPERRVRVYGHLDEALEWVEDHILEEERLKRSREQAMELRDLDLFRGRKEETLAALEQCMERQSYAAGQRIFSRGDAGDALFLIRRGAVRIVLPLGDTDAHHLATFGRGDFFGEMSFLDQEPRSADAIAFSDTDLFILSRGRFDVLAEEHKRLGIKLLDGLARALALRLRRANTELRAFHEA